MGHQASNDLAPFALPWETYAPVAWDFSNLEEVIAKMLEDDDLRLAVAEEGQKRYFDSWSMDGMQKYAERLNWLLKSARDAYLKRKGLD